ncbi:hypothetical protein WME76_21335 [Sorangium sp. So ce119]|uniref:hypothetical protein n=1 Tax=Sorangium sp. So ce119 TaxID=3133279 RepID=UPI003F5EB86E
MAPRLLGMVVEGPDDARTVPGLVDGVLTNAFSVPEGEIGQARSYCGIELGASCVTWSSVHRCRAPRKHGHFRGKPALEDARTAVLALRGFVAREPQPRVVVLVRDSDGREAERRQGLEQARQDAGWPFEVILGVAHPMRECWVLAGFIPGTEPEIDSLADLRKELGFDPTARSHELDASSKTAKKSPKRVLVRLAGGEHEREARCWTEPPLDRLRERGRNNGLAAFLSEVEDHLAPVFANAVVEAKPSAELGPAQPPAQEVDDTGAGVPDRS